MPSPRRNGKRGKNKPVVIIFKDSPISYLCGMALSSGEERCLKFANEMEARTWVINQQMLGGRHDVHLCSDILKHIDKGEKVIRCDSCFTYGPNSTWAGYDYGIDLGPAEFTPITVRQGAESASVSESAISSAHSGSRGICDDLRRTIDGIQMQDRVWYEESAMATSHSGLSEASDASPRMHDSEPMAGIEPTVEEIAQPGRTEPIGPGLRAVLDESMVSRMASEYASAAVDAVSEERSRLEQRYIAEFLDQGRGPMSLHEYRYEDCAGTCYDPR